MSDLGFRYAAPAPAAAPAAARAAAPAAGFSPLATFAAPPSSFRADARYAEAPLRPRDVLPQESFATELTDPVTDAYTQGFAAGHEQAMTEAAEIVADEAAVREKLSLSFARMDAVLEEELRQRLRETVEALCAAAIAPLAIDPEALARRIERAVSLLARGDDARVIRLHPLDVPMVCAHFAADWTIEPDATLERGSVRVETAQGGVEDGPATWRLAITEALARC